MNMIHPSSNISSRADIEKNVQIGPFCYIGENVRIRKNCKLHGNIFIDGNVDIGDETEIFPFSSIGTIPQDLKYNGEKTKVELKEVKYIDPNSGVVTDVELSVVTSINCPTQFVATSGDYDNYPSQCRFGTYSASPNNTCLNIVKSVK